MAVKITDTCISCGACIDECPVEAIVDEDENPTGEDIYFVHPETCVKSRFSPDHLGSAFV